MPWKYGQFRPLDASRCSRKRTSSSTTRSPTPTMKSACSILLNLHSLWNSSICSVCLLFSSPATSITSRTACASSPSSVMAGICSSTSTSKKCWMRISFDSMSQKSCWPFSSCTRTWLFIGTLRSSSLWFLEIWSLKTSSWTSLDTSDWRTLDWVKGISRVLAAPTPSAALQNI